MLRALLSFLGFGSSEDSDWTPTAEVSEQTVDIVEAVDGKTYRKVRRVEKEVNFDTGAIRTTPVDDSDPKLVVE